MTFKDKETIQRMLGRIEAISYFVEDKIGDALIDAIDAIDSIVDREKGGEDYDTKRGDN